MSALVSALKSQVSELVDVSEQHLGHKLLT